MTIPPRLPADLRKTARRWLDANPTNAPRRIADVFPDSIIQQARARRLIDCGCLVAAGCGRYVLDDWCLADVLNVPPEGQP